MLMDAGKLSSPIESKQTLETWMIKIYQLIIIKKNFHFMEKKKNNRTFRRIHKFFLNIFMYILCEILITVRILNCFKQFN